MGTTLVCSCVGETLGRAQGTANDGGEQRRVRNLLPVTCLLVPFDRVVVLLSWKQLLWLLRGCGLKYCVRQ